MVLKVEDNVQVTECPGELTVGICIALTEQVNRNKSKWSTGKKIFRITDLS